MSEQVVKQEIKPCKAIMKTDFRLQQVRHTYDQTCASTAYEYERQ